MAVPGLRVHSTVDGLPELPKLTDRLNVPHSPWQLLGGRGVPEWRVGGQGIEREGRDLWTHSVSKQLVAANCLLQDLEKH